MAGRAAEEDVGRQRPDGVALHVCRDPETLEFLELWIQKNPRLDRRVTSHPRTVNGATTGWGYITRRSSGQGLDVEEDGRLLCQRMHLCTEWPCKSDHRRRDGTVDEAKWGLFGAPRHLPLHPQGWPAAPPAPAPAGPSQQPGGLPLAPAHAGDAAASGGPGTAAPALALGQPLAAGAAAPPGLGGPDAGGAPAAGQEPPLARTGRRLPASFGLGPRPRSRSPQPGPGPHAGPLGSLGETPPAALASAPFPVGGSEDSGEPAVAGLPWQARPDADCTSAPAMEEPPQSSPAPGAALPAPAAAEPTTRAAEAAEAPAAAAAAEPMTNDLGPAGSGATTGAAGPAAAGGATAAAGAQRADTPAGLSVAEALARSEAAGRDAAAHWGAVLQPPEVAELQLRHVPEPTTAADTALVPAVAEVAQGPETLQQQGPVTDGQGALSKLLELTRSVRRRRRPVGHSAFVVLGLARKMRVRVWEGENKVDVTNVYLPGSVYSELQDTAITDAAFCAPVPQDAGPAKWAPVDDAHPAGVCSHFLTLVSADQTVHGGDPAYVDGFYARRGMMVVSTVADGDCGIDAMLHMLGTQSTLEARDRLREDPHTNQPTQ